MEVYSCYLFKWNIGPVLGPILGLFLGQISPIESPPRGLVLTRMLLSIEKVLTGDREERVETVDCFDWIAGRVVGR